MLLKLHDETAFETGFEIGVLKWLRWLKLPKWLKLVKMGVKDPKV